MRTPKWCSIVFGLFVLSCFIHNAHAAEVKGPAQKLGRGFVHVLASPFQIPKQIIQTASETEPFYLGPWSGVTLGTGKGLYDTGRQLVSGLYDIFTFPTPVGKNWAPLFESSSLFPEI